MAETMIKADGLQKAYRLGKQVAVPVLRDVSFSIDSGAFVALVGPSGSGKSTLLNLLGGLDRPSAGALVVDGQDISKLSDQKMADYRQHSVGMVFQSFNLIPHLTAQQNVAVPFLLAGGSRAAANRRATELLSRVGLQERSGHRPSELSGGEQQRVAIARSLMNSPKVLLADEPTGNLDTKNGQEIIALLHDLNTKDGVTLLVVTHDEHVAAAAQRQLHMIDGQLS